MVNERASTVPLLAEKHGLQPGQAALPARTLGGAGGIRLLPDIGKDRVMDLLWIIIVVLVVLALLGYFGRGRFGR